MAYEIIYHGIAVRCESAAEVEALLDGEATQRRSGGATEASNVKGTYWLGRDGAAIIPAPGEAPTIISEPIAQPTRPPAAETFGQFSVAAPALPDDLAGAVASGAISELDARFLAAKRKGEELLLRKPTFKDNVTYIDDPRVEPSAADPAEQAALEEFRRTRTRQMLEAAQPDRDKNADSRTIRFG